MSRVLDSSISRSPKCRFAETASLMVSPLGYTLSPYDLPSYDRSLLRGSSTQGSRFPIFKTPEKPISKIPKHFVSRLSPPFTILGFPDFTFHNFVNPVALSLHYPLILPVPKVPKYPPAATCSLPGLFRSSFGFWDSTTPVAQFLCLLESLEYKNPVDFPFFATFSPTKGCL
jgi:hypothetical protein